jgi:hypothetical protein
MATLFDGFYQMGFVVADIAAAMETLGRVHGVTRFRHRAGAAWMDAAHAWVGSTMIELIELREGAPAIYTAEPPPAAGAMRLHHHGYRVQDEAAWHAICARIDAAGLATPMRGAVMNGALNYLYADTRALTGIYSEFVFLTGEALAIYDDVPRN